MGRRGRAAFKHTDGVRMLRLARDGGLEPGAVEIAVGADGSVVYRVYGEKVATLKELTADSVSDAKDWQAEIDKLKGKAKTGRNQSRGSKIR